MVAHGCASEIWAPIGNTTLLFKYPLQNAITHGNIREIVSKIYNEARIIRELTHVAPKYAPTQTMLLKTKEMDIPIMQMLRVGNMTMKEAFNLPMPIFTNVERALVWLQLFDCVQLCTQGKINMNDFMNPGNVMITWHKQGDMPIVKVIDFQEWNIGVDPVKVFSNNERHTFGLLKLVKRHVDEAGHDCVTGKLRYLYCMTHAFNITDVLDLLCPYCIREFPDSTNQLRQNIMQTYTQAIRPITSR